jgi:hypothetical protein
MTTTLRPRIDPNFSAATVKAPSWKNLLFETNGNSHLCDPVYPSEAAARAGADEDLAEIAEWMAESPGKMFAGVLHDGTVILLSDISYVLQVPWSQA